MLKTVRVPPEMASVFEKAEEVVSRYFRDRRDEPERGTIEIFGERYVLVRAASLSVEFFRVVRDLYGPGRENDADDFTRNILFDLSHSIGKSDARNFHAKMNLSDPIARLSAGPVHFSHTGWAFVDIGPESVTTPGLDTKLVYEHPYSFESDAWLGSGMRAEFPVCIMNAGYSSGWTEESFGIPLVAAEVMCRAKGDASCRFVMAHPDRIEHHVQDYSKRGAVQIPDFFARKRIEEDLRLRVEERTRDLERQIVERDRIEKKLLQTARLEAVGRLTGGIAHDFNNLMSIVIGRSRIALDAMPGDAEVRGTLEEILRAGERAASLTQQLLAFSRAQVLKRERIDVDHVVRELSRTLLPLVGEDIELAISLGEAGNVEADRGQLEQVLMNLVVNARDAMPDGGTISIATRPVEVVPPEASLMDVSPGHYARIEVGDTGSGMDEATLARVFEPFFTTKGEGKGTGLGLSTAYGIVRQTGGALSVTSAVGKGSTFVIHLPISEAAAEALPPPVPTSSEVRGTETILLVEDRRDVREAVRDFLHHYGYQVIAAPGAQEALDAAARMDEVVLLLTDVVMPRIGGSELAARLRERFPQLKVIFMSGYADDPRLLAEIDARTSAFLQKPFEPEELARTIRSLLDGKPKT